MIKKQSGSEAAWQYALVGLAIIWVALWIALPVAEVLYGAFLKGPGAYLRALLNTETLHAACLTVLAALLSVAVNLVFGVTASWLIAKHHFRGKSLLVTLIDLPFAVSPVIAGLVFVLVFGAQAFLGRWLDVHGIQILYALPAIVLATAFITFPFVAREVLPVMESVGAEEEEAALTLGASGWQAFWLVTLPNIRWGLLYGVILCTARAFGEFGAVSVVSGRIAMQTNTLSLHVEKLYQEYQSQAAFAVASVLLLLALLTLVAKSAVEWRLKHALPAAAGAGGKA
jgi:sulfate transport system permease protein